MGALLGCYGHDVAGEDNNPLEELLNELENADLGDQARSWLSADENELISGAELGWALPDDVIDQVAWVTNTPVQEVADQLALVLPEVVDRLTPDGQMPPESLMDLVEQHRLPTSTKRSSNWPVV
ncbi:YidB family protein [Streptomyces sp. NPDC050636]|uniref:YidB family protein n=1 Tax=Streptomyces sp. NPDC050636 TaxID=3154510 RepID=UPI003427522F